MPGGVKKREELPEVIFVAADRVRGSVAHRTQINQKLFYRGIHFPLPDRDFRGFALHPE